MEIKLFDSYLTEGRNKAIDFLKLYASVLVVLCHCMMKFITNNYSPLFNLIWLTQIPLFMFVSGFTNINISNYNSIGKYFYKLLKNALILLIPCLSFMIVECLLKQISLFDGLTNFYYSPNL